MKKEYKGLKISEKGKLELDKSSYWTRIVSTSGFILLALYATFFLVGIFNGIEEFKALDLLILLFPLSVLFLFFFQALWLYRFSTKVVKGLDNDNQEELDEGLRNLSYYWKMVGILVILGFILMLIFMVSILFENQL